MKKRTYKKNNINNINNNNNNNMKNTKNNDMRKSKQRTKKMNDAE